MRAGQIKVAQTSGGKEIKRRMEGGGEEKKRGKYFRLFPRQPVT